MKYIDEIKEKQLTYVQLVATKGKLLGDEVSEVSLYDFSKANLSLEARIEAVTLIASTCYANGNSIGKTTLFNRLEQESLGLPSSSFEFIPMLFNSYQIRELVKIYPRIDKVEVPSILLHGEMVKGKNGEKYWLTNYRAVCNYYEFLLAKGVPIKDFRLQFNTRVQDLEIIRDNFKVFLSVIDINTRSQYVRHRTAAWQELSRRYVSGKKLDFEFYTSENMKPITSTFSGVEITTADLIEICKNHYAEAQKNKVPAQDARRCLPQALYTVIWSGWTPMGLDNFFKLRLDKHAQNEIRLLAEAKKELIQ